jgi:photosystem II stability/assembly factor-like uncharacterized protein
MEPSPTLVVSPAAWTSGEDAAIRVGVGAGESWKEISEDLPGRTVFATKNRGQRLGLKHPEAGRAWTVGEDATLRAGIEAGKCWSRIAEKLPGRNEATARHWANVLGVERGEK